MTFLPENPFAGRSDEWKLGYQFGIDTFGKEMKAATERGILPKPDFAWVIEKGSGSNLKYYAPVEPGEWSADHLKACRFARKEDAEAIQFRHVIHCDLPVEGTRVCEHGWH